ncbi:hypothetical protein TrVE_jg2006 [Triparma verrucosa]|uniref:Small nuclear ribonucleoprotein E n=2 Tax=Triparma TaxID=722752 RepID=A0A9W7BC71_9STRA|nr:hypothetical protein TrVE_jg2006 [Triparma verrucosa]GMH87936.1 hypothetical protein TrST_g5106 [Triparma strigata]|mmetsp:Transcript_2884/g.5329  ORF Transcript_2884/g.5329 Transcript_2884/m.5329 type:complete len:86 (-) Transcript_2884:142-399(-)|eukprot:CAMPEP_0182496660 /NCGR_PEP_ID=MMETSP1321-20130603/5271_1 /TAXON_ID=91990 /ORGANISM="Bolidomonas sp., Strain RCC1657" /LENGTH=85 /DNA_ID=CAMNT_0024700321 /DNA_START=216 /DNA_END=473 /DNA_ORIENTATION=+
MPSRKQVMTLPINQIFTFLQSKTTVSIWLYEDTKTRIEGVIIGFDEFMNLTLDEAKEIDLKKGTSEDLGKILLKGDSITLLQKKE